jgi:hypothetical protein
VDVTFSTQTTGTAGTVASTVKPGAGVAASPAKRSIGKGDLSASQSLTLPVGYQGVVYPWSSASMGDLATECHSVDPPHCVTQVHLQGDVALAVWQYHLATGDTAWRRARGWQRRP